MAEAVGAGPGEGTEVEMAAGQGRGIDRDGYGAVRRYDIVSALYHLGQRPEWVRRKRIRRVIGSVYH